MSTLYAIGGWAHQATSLEPLANPLRQDFTVSVFSPHAFSPRYAALLQQSVVRDKPAILLGWSWGGLLALAAALAHPTLVKILILVASTARFCRTTNYDHGVPLSELRAMKIGLRKDCSNTLRRFFERSFAPVQPDSMILDRLVREASQWNVRELTQGLNALEAMDFRAQLGALTIPTLIIHGMRDAIISYSAAQFLADGIPGAVLLSIPDAGHNLPLTHAELLVHKITAFAHE